MNIKPYTAGVKKELWEFHKILLWLPIIIGGLAVALPLLQLVTLEEYQWGNILHQLNEISVHTLSEYEIEKIGESSFAAIAGLFIPFIAISLIVQLYYFTSCLSDERRDLSVYFWRSLPVSDAATVGTKLLTGGLIIPAIFMAVATLTLLAWVVIALVISVVLAGGYNISLWEVWGHVAVISSLAKVWINLLPYFLWMLPVYTWFMLASMFARKAPFLWAVIPVAALVIIDLISVEFLNLDSHLIAPVLAEYITISDSMVKDNYALAGDVSMLPFHVLLDKINIFAILAAGVMLYVTYWLRVNRSEK